jgi:hypothetical protein
VLVTFLIGRVMPIDPVLAIVGDRAPGRRGAPPRAWNSGSTSRCGSSSRSISASSRVGDFGALRDDQPHRVEDIKRFFPATMELATVAHRARRGPDRHPLGVLAGGASRAPRGGPHGAHHLPRRAFARRPSCWR